MTDEQLCAFTSDPQEASVCWTERSEGKESKAILIFLQFVVSLELLIAWLLYASCQSEVYIWVAYLGLRHNVSGLRGLPSVYPCNTCAMERAMASGKLSLHIRVSVASIFSRVAAASIFTRSPILACTNARMYNDSLRSSVMAATPVQQIWYC